MKPAEYKKLLPKRNSHVIVLLTFNRDLVNPDYTIDIPEGGAALFLMGIYPKPKFFTDIWPTALYVPIDVLFRYHDEYVAYDMAIPNITDILAMVHIIKTAIQTNQKDAIDEAIAGDKTAIPAYIRNFYRPDGLEFIAHIGFEYFIKNREYLARFIGFRFLQTVYNAFEECHRYLTSRGYIYRYYIYVKADNPMVQANMGILPITPQSFEIFAVRQAFKHMDSGRLGRQIVRHYEATRLTPPILGWKKADMLRAINEAGVRQPMLYKPRITAQARYREGPTPSYMANMIPREVVGLQPPAEDRSGRGYFTRYLPGLPDIDPNDPDFNPTRLYGVRAYYTEIYRRIYHTRTYFDWDAMCRMRPGYINENKEALKIEFNLDDADFEDETRTCKLIADKVKIKKKFVKEIASALPFQSEAIKFPIDSRWVTENVDPEVLRHFYKSPVPKSVFEQKIILERWCIDNTISKEEYITGIKRIRLAYLLPPNTKSYSKSQLCDYILDIITRETEKYGFIELDCSDPLIQKRHILNAMTIMGLGEVFKNIDYLNITKEELCQQVTAYITMLREQTAFRFAAENRPANFEPDPLELQDSVESEEALE